MNNKKQIVNELHTLLDQFDVAKGPELMAGTDPVTGNQNSQLRNYRKKMIRLFCSFSPQRQEEELEAFRTKLKEKQSTVKEIEVV